MKKTNTNIDLNDPQTLMPTLSELLRLPAELSEEERGACICLANFCGVEAAQDAAQRILRRKRELS